MTLYNYLYSDNLLKYEKNRILNDKQKDFCESIIRDIPELVEYDPNNHVHDRCMLFGMRNNIKRTERIRIPVGITGKDNSSYYNVFDIINKPVKEWDFGGHSVLYDMSHGRKKYLPTIVKNWLLRYERKIKIQSICSKSM